MSFKLFVLLLVLGVLVMNVQAGGKKHKGHSNESKDKSNESKDKSNESKDKSNESKDKSNESKSHNSKSNESKSDHSKSSESNSHESESGESKSDGSKSNEDCKEGPILPPPDKCGPNEEWASCGTACPLTCDKPEPKICIQKCVVGCQCKKGLLRNKGGKCVEPCDC